MRYANRYSAYELREQLLETQKVLVLCLLMLHLQKLPRFNVYGKEGGPPKPERRMTRAEALEDAEYIAQINVRDWLKGCQDIVDWTSGSSGHAGEVIRPKHKKRLR